MRPLHGILYPLYLTDFTCSLLKCAQDCRKSYASLICGLGGAPESHTLTPNQQCTTVSTPRRRLKDLGRVDCPTEVSQVWETVPLLLGSSTNRIWEKGPLGAERQFLVHHTALKYSSWASYCTLFCVSSCFHCCIWTIEICIAYISAYSKKFYSEKILDSGWNRICKLWGTYPLHHSATEALVAEW